MKIIKFIRKSGVLVGTAVIAAGVTYFIVSSVYDSQITELQNQVNQLKKAELQARVTQRVSEQLEDIANEQTIISNREKDRAEKQTRIAEQQKKEAEREKGLSQQAQQRALASADEAHKARMVAEEQSKLATQNMLLAQQARAHADTLLYNSLANSLAQSSLTQSQAGQHDLSMLLSTAAWHFSNLYNGDALYQPNVYKALLLSSGSLLLGGNDLRGNLRRVRVQDDCTIGVSDYGELICSDSKTTHSVKLGDYDMRDFVSNGIDDNTILCADGRLLSVDMTNLRNGCSAANIPCRLMIRLPLDSWHNIIKTNDGLAAMGDKTIAWIKNGKYAGSRQLDYEITAIGMQGDCLHVFARNGNHYVSDKVGVIAEMPMTSLKENEVVTSYLFDSNGDYHVLGMADGRILAFDADGKRVAELFGHTAPVTDLHIWNGRLGSTSYDSTMRLWNLEGLGGMMASIDILLPNWALCFDVNKNTGEVWIGTEHGNMPHFYSEAATNALMTQNSLTRDFTTKEWNFYVGAGIPQLKFLGKGGEK